jgi:hypothetical protein
MPSDKSFPKVLLGCPINMIKEYCLPDWFDMIQNLTYPNYDIFLVDNSRSPQFHMKLVDDYGLNISYNPPGDKEARVYMAESIEMVRIKAMEGNYSHLFILECDIFPPKQIIELLICQQKPVIGTAYWTEHGSNTRIQLLANTRHDAETYTSRILKWNETLKFFDGKTKPMFANGNGCILIERSVFSEMTFHIVDGIPGHADSFFHIDLFQMGIENLVDTSIVPRHWNSRWAAVTDDLKHHKMWNEYLKTQKV